MSKIGAQLDGLDSEFMEFFGDELLITNYEYQEKATAPDEWDDPTEKQETADSPISVVGQIDPVSADAENQPWARDIDADVVIYVDDDTTISDGEVTDMPYPSDVEDPATLRTYRVTYVFDEGNGVLRCLATSMPRRSE